MHDATAYQVQVVKLCLIWVGLRGVNRDVHTIDRLLLLLNHVFYYVWIPAGKRLLLQPLDSLSLSTGLAKTSVRSEQASCIGRKLTFGLAIDKTLAHPSNKRKADETPVETRGDEGLIDAKSTFHKSLCQSAVRQTAQASRRPRIVSQ